MLNILKRKTGFIELATETNLETSEQWTNLDNDVQLRLVDTAVIEVKPVESSEQFIVMSCGIHGNETAPIEIISELISQIVNCELEPKVNLLFILGNPESMKIEDRFTSINMNRLFAGAFKNYELNDENRYELRRAERLEDLVSNFFEKSNAGSNKLHLDLHTAIKPSFHKTFAIRPFCQTMISAQSKSLLKAMGIEAVLQHNKVSTTFSYFSVEKFDAEAYTLELGKVKKFGENDPADFKKAANTLTALITDEEIAEHSEQPLIEYKVVAEIIRDSEDFKFYVSDDVENFTSFPQGFLISEDKNHSYRVAFEQEAVVFPNPNVPVGQRVAVMVTSETF